MILILAVYLSNHIIYYQTFCFSTYAQQLSFNRLLVVDESTCFYINQVLIFYDN